MMTESRVPVSNPMRGGALSKDDPAKSPPPPPSDPGKPLALSPRRSKEEEASESDSESALEKSGRGRKRKRVTDPRDRDSAGSGSDSSTHSSPLREPKPPLVPIGTEEDGNVLYGFTEDQAAVDKYYADVKKYEEKCARRELLLTSGRSSVTERYTLKETEAVITYAKSVLTLSSYLGAVREMIGGWFWQLGLQNPKLNRAKCTSCRASVHHYLHPHARDHVSSSPCYSPMFYV